MQKMPGNKGSSKRKKPYPMQVCFGCGKKASGGRNFDVSTVHDDLCEVCGRIGGVTEPRDFYYPVFKGFELP